MSFLTSLRPTFSSAAAAAATAGNGSARLFSTTPVSRVAKLTIVGRLAATPELIPTSTGKEVVRYAVGTNSGSGEQRSTTWWKVASFAQEGSGRDRLLSLGKGSLVYVEGEASMRKYERDGAQTLGLSVVQSKLEVLKRNDPNADDAIVEED